MQIGNCGGVVAQRSDLAKHVKAVCRLVVIALGFERRVSIARAVDPLGGHPQAADVQTFKAISDFLGGAAVRQKSSALLLESRDERGGADADLVAWPGLEQYGGM